MKQVVANIRHKHTLAKKRITIMHLQTYDCFNGTYLQHIYDKFIK